MFRTASSTVMLAFLALAFWQPGTGRVSAGDEPEAAETPAEPASPSPEPVKYKLAFKFHPQQVVRYAVSQQFEITTQLSGETETAKNSSEWKRHYKVTGVDATTGAGDLELSIDWVHMVASFENGNSDPEPIEFQSDDPDKHPEKYKHILETVGKARAAIRFSAQGKPLKVLWGAPQQAAGPNTTAQAPQPAHGTGPETTPETYFLPLPEQPVAIGEAWKERFDILARDSGKNLVRVTIQRTYKLAAVKDGLATIEFRTAILTPIQDPSIAGQLIQREVSGKLLLDIERGLVLSRESGVENSVLNPFGQKSSMYAKSVYRERLLEGDDAAASREQPASIGATANK